MGAMQNTAILNAGFSADSNAINIPSNNAHRPNGTIIINRDIADNSCVLVDIDVLANGWCDVLVGFDAHVCS